MTRTFYACFDTVADGPVSGIREVGAAVRREAILDWVVATITIGSGG